LARHVNGDFPKARSVEVKRRIQPKPWPLSDRMLVT